jgi:hypothetical protein
MLTMILKGEIKTSSEISKDSWVKKIKKKK